MKVPFNQITQHYLDEKPIIDALIQDVLQKGPYIGGSYVQDFEISLVTYHHANHALACANGTDALYIALKALGIGKGDQVLTTAFSWIATAMAISQTGAEPVFIDVDPTFLQLDLNLAAQKITSKTKAIAPVYLYGDLSQRSAFIDFAKKHSLALVEDAAQVHGLSVTMDQGLDRHLACFSFYPTKQLGALGDAGAVLTNNQELFDKAKRLANLGAKYPARDFELIGINSRMDPLQAVVLNHRLQHIDSQLSKRRDFAAIYNEKLPDEYIKMPFSASHSWYQYVIRKEDRNTILRQLEASEIGFGIHYEFTLPGTTAYGNQRGFTVAELAAEQVISIPIDPSLSEVQIHYVCEVLNDLIS